MGNFLSICSVSDFDFDESLFGNKKKKKIKIYNSSRNSEFPPFISSSVSIRFDPSGNFL